MQYDSQPIGIDDLELEREPTDPELAMLEDAEPEPEPQDPSRTYWAALEDPEHFGSAMMDRVEQYYQRVDERGLQHIWGRSYRAYYGLSPDGGYHASSEIRHDGEQGELSLVKVNQYRSLARHQLTITTKNRPQFQARAVNTDHKSLEQTQTAQGVLEYFMREKRLEQKLKASVESGIVFGEGFLAITWDPTAGDDVEVPGEVDPMTGQPGPTETQRQGDLVGRVFTPLDVVRDWRRPAEDQDWRILRTFRNKYDIAAQYPELRDEILDVEAGSEDKARTFEVVQSWDPESDDVPVYELYHRPTNSVPEGRAAIFLTADLILFDGPLPYDDLPVYRMSPGDFLGSSYGYSDAWDVLGLQQVLDSLFSVMQSNMDAFGLQNIVAPDDIELDDSQKHGGLMIWKLPMAAFQMGAIPQGINLTRMPEGIEGMIKMTVGYMENLMGLNAAARGNVEAMGKGASGSAWAFIHAMAIEYNSGLQAGFAQLLEDAGTGVLNVLKRYADTPRMVAIAGVDDAYSMQQFTGDRLGMVERVVVDPGNPVLRTSQGRWELAQMLMRFQAEVGVEMFKSPEQFMQVISTGQIKSMTSGPAKELSGIKLENEVLANGPEVQVEMVQPPMGGDLMQLETVPQVPALIYDDHELHITEHRAVLHDPSRRTDPAVRGAVEAHLRHHEWQMVQKAINEQGLQAMAQGGMQAPGPAGPEQGPPEGGGGPPAEMPQAPEELGADGAAAMPNMPTDPMTGEQAEGGI